MYIALHLHWPYRDRYIKSIHTKQVVRWSEYRYSVIQAVSLPETSSWSVWMPYITWACYTKVK